MDPITRAILVKQRRAALVEAKAKRNAYMRGAEQGWGGPYAGRRSGMSFSQANGRRAHGIPNERLLDGGDASIDRREVDKVSLMRRSPKVRNRHWARSVMRQRVWAPDYSTGASGRPLY